MSTTLATTIARHPFLIGPDPSLLYLTASLKATLQKVRLVFELRQGLTTMLGDVGMGKTTVLRYLHGQYVNREDCVTAYLPSPNYPSEFAFLKSICGEFGLPPKRSMVAQEQELRGFLRDVYKQGKTAIVFIDEAHCLTGKHLELIRVMLNFETDKTKLLQILLVAQLELRDKLRDPSKRAIRSRIFAPSLLAPLTLNETREMIAYRCEQVQVANPFPDKTVEAIYLKTGGVPREVLKISLMGWELAQRLGESIVPPEAIEEIAPEATYEQHEADE
jgi:general secretion pathway protein A